MTIDNPIEFEIEVLATDATESDLDRMTWNLLSELKRTDVESVNLVSVGTAPEGSKGDPITIGTIAMTALPVDGLASYMSAFRDAFRSKFPRQVGEIGGCKMVSWPDIYIVQVLKQRVEGILNVERCIVQGAKDMLESLIQKTQGKGVINTTNLWFLWPYLMML